MLIRTRRTIEGKGQELRVVARFVLKYTSTTGFQSPRGQIEAHFRLGLGNPRTERLDASRGPEQIRDAGRKVGCRTQPKRARFPSRCFRPSIGPRTSAAHANAFPPASSTAVRSSRTRRRLPCPIGPHPWSPMPSRRSLPECGNVVHGGAHRPERAAYDRRPFRPKSLSADRLDGFARSGSHCHVPARLPFPCPPSHLPATLRATA